jgi:23S rRNA (adenine2503-C2)-methyltransferase
MSDLAKSLREKLRTAARIEACRSSASTNRPTAPSSGCSTSATATPSKPCSFPRTTAAPCACRRRPAARSAAASAPPGTRASRATSPRRDRGPAVVRRTLPARHLKTQDRVISNVVMMGMGEPLQNYAALVPALRTMLDDHGYGLSRRRVTVSTSGVVPMIDRLGPDCPWPWPCRCTLPTTPARQPRAAQSQVPAGRTAGRVRRYLEHAPRDFITFEYCMLDGVNDQPEHARQLVDLVRSSGIVLQVQPDPLQPVPAVRPDAIAATPACSRSRNC